VYRIISTAAPAKQASAAKYAVPHCRLQSKLQAVVLWLLPAVALLWSHHSHNHRDMLV
jgi:hypothetical protein